MKIGLVYTSTTPELTELVNKEVKKNLGNQISILHYEDPTILAEVREYGYVTPNAAQRLLQMYLTAATDGADAILNACSSVGEVADCAQDMARYIGVPIVRIDEEMCREAVRQGSKIAVLATLPTTLEPTKNTLTRVARELGKHIELIDGLIDGAFGVNQTEFKTLLLNKASELKESVDVILLCQGSMAYCEEYLHLETNKIVLSSPRFGACALKDALKSKGAIKEV